MAVFGVSSVEISNSIETEIVLDKKLLLILIMLLLNIFTAYICYSFCIRDRCIPIT
jgi:hypothetical protein